MYKKTKKRMEYVSRTGIIDARPRRAVLKVRVSGKSDADIGSLFWPAAGVIRRKPLPSSIVGPVRF